MVYIPFWICIFAGAWIDARERRFPNELAGACAVAALAGVWLDRGVNTALDHAGLARGFEIGQGGILFAHFLVRFGQPLFVTLALGKLLLDAQMTRQQGADFPG